MKIVRYILVVLTLLVVFLVGAIVCADLLVKQTAAQFITNEAADLPAAQAVMILGAGVKTDGTLTPLLKDRTDTAISVYQTGHAAKILISGDNGTREYNEVIPIRDYVLKAGVPAEDIFVDYAGFDTYDSMYRARAVFAVDSLIVVTQPFHLSRAVYLAHKLGLTVQGYPADRYSVANKNYVRERLARVKAVADVALHSQPTYLGEQIPITGDGRATIPVETSE